MASRVPSLMASRAPDSNGSSSSDLALAARAAASFSSICRPVCVCLLCLEASAALVLVRVHRGLFAGLLLVGLCDRAFGFFLHLRDLHGLRELCGLDALLR